MRLLVSAASVDDAVAALDGGADIVDAKDPAAGALGAVAPEIFRDIVGAVGGRAPVSAALGDADDPDVIEAAARVFVSIGASFVKVGFSDLADPARAAALAAAAVRGARQESTRSGVVLVAYADAPPGSVSPTTLLDLAESAGADGVLLDTSDKQGPRLTELRSLAWLTEWVALAHDRALMAAVAGRLRADDLPVVSRCGADVSGVRGAACTGGRGGRVAPGLVRDLRRACQQASDITGRRARRGPGLQPAAPPAGLLQSRGTPGPAAARARSTRR